MNYSGDTGNARGYPAGPQEPQPQGHIQMPYNRPNPDTRYNNNLPPLAAVSPAVSPSPHPSIIVESQTASSTMPIGIGKKLGGPGVAPLVLARIRPADSRALLPDFNMITRSNTVSLYPDNTSSTPELDIEFDHVAGQNDTTTSLFTNKLDAMVTAGVSRAEDVMIIVTGGAGAGRTHTVHGSGGADGGGVLSLSVDTALATARTLGFPFSSRCGYLEVFEEGIRDLTTASSALPSVVDTPDAGVHVSGQSLHKVGSHDDVSNIVATGLQRRTAMAGGSLGDRAWLVFTLEILSRRPEGDHLSRVTIAETAAVDPLAGEEADIRERSLMAMYKSLFAFKSVVRGLADPKDAPFVRHDDSQATKLLREGLGRSAHLAVVACLQPTDFHQCYSTLTLVDWFKRVRNCPIPGTPSSRLLLSQLKSRIENAKSLGGSGDTSKAVDEAQRRIQQLEGQVMKERMDRLKVQEEKEVVLTRMNNIRSDLKESANTKEKATEDLLTAEEDRLRLSKALVDAELKVNEAEEKMAQLKFELENKVLSTENQSIEQELRYKGSEQKIQDLSTNLAQSEEERRDLVSEFLTLKENYIKVHKDLEEEKIKNEELGLELLTLVSKKDVAPISAVPTFLHTQATHRSMKPTTAMSAERGLASTEELEEARAEAQLWRERYEEVMKQVEEGGGVQQSQATTPQQNQVGLTHSDISDAVRKGEAETKAARQYCEESIEVMRAELQSVTKSLMALRPMERPATADDSYNDLLLTAQARALSALVNAHKDHEAFITAALSRVEERASKLLRQVVTAANQSAAPSDLLRQLNELLGQDESEILRSRLSRVQANLSSDREEHIRAISELRRQARANQKQSSEESANSSIQEKLLHEIERLKKTQTPKVDTTALDEMRVENARLRAEVARSSAMVAAGGGGGDMDMDILMQELQVFTSTTLAEMENERSELLTRATLAEEQLFAYEDAQAQSIARYTTQISQLSSQVADLQARLSASNRSRTAASIPANLPPIPGKILVPPLPV